MKIYINKKKIKNTLNIILISFFMFLGILVSYNARGLGHIISNRFFLIFALCMSIYLVDRRILKIKNDKIITAFNIFFMLVGIASVINGEFIMSFAAIQAACCFFIFYNIFILEDIVSYRIVFYSTIISTIIIIIIYHVNSFNSQGIIISFTGIIFLNMLCMRKKTNILYFVLCVTPFIVLLFLTKSRISIITFICISLTSFMYLFVHKISLKNSLFSSFVLLLVILNKSIIIKNLNKALFNKWGNSDITSNRLIIWDYIFQHNTIMGNGIELFSNGDAHNTFLQAMYSFGYVSALFIIIAMILIFIRITKVENKIIYLNFFLAWCMISSFENLDFFTSRMIPITLLFFIHVSFLINEKRKKYNKDE